MNKLLCSLSLLLATTTSCTPVINFVAPPSMPPPREYKDPIDQAVKQAQELRDRYVKRSCKKMASLPFYNFLLLGASGAGVGGLLFGAHSDFVAIAGLAGGAIAGVRTVFDPAGVATIYIDGTHALNCVIASVAPLRSEASESALNKTEKIAEDLKNSKMSAETKLNALSNPQTGGTCNAIPGSVDKAKSDATAALNAAQDALSAFENESNVLQDARTEVPLQVSAIHTKVSKKLLDAHNVSFSDLQAAMTETITSIAQQKATINAIRKSLEKIQPAQKIQSTQDMVKGSGQCPNDLIQKLDKLNGATSALKTDVDRLLDVIPNFNDALERTKMCAAAI